MYNFEEIKSDNIDNSIFHFGDELGKFVKTLSNSTEKLLEMTTRGEIEQKEINSILLNTNFYIKDIEKRLENNEKELYIRRRI